MIRSHIPVNTWLVQVPTVDEVRPARCPCCGAAGRPVGACLVLHGQGLRERQLRGPPSPGGQPACRVVLGRRYECQRCGAVLIVLPCEVTPRRHFAATAIAAALALYGLCDQSHAEVRAAVNDVVVVGVRAERRWITLARWIDAVGERRLFASLPAMAVGQGRRAVAARAAMAIGAHAPPSLPEGALAERVFAGVVQMA